jgi:hypothetical protein
VENSGSKIADIAIIARHRRDQAVRESGDRVIR